MAAGGREAQEELEALLASAARLGDWELVRTLDPGASTLDPSEAPRLTFDGVPAALASFLLLSPWQQGQ